MRLRSKSAAKNKWNKRKLFDLIGTGMVVGFLALDNLERNPIGFKTESKLNSHVDNGASANSSSSAAPTTVGRGNATVGERAVPIATDAVEQGREVGEGATIESGSPFVLWQQQSQRALDQLAGGSAFDSAFSSRASVGKGISFPVESLYPSHCSWHKGEQGRTSNCCGWRIRLCNPQISAVTQKRGS